MIGRLTGIAAAGGGMQALPQGAGQVALPAAAHVTSLNQLATQTQHAPAHQAVSGSVGQALALPRQSQVANMIDLAQVEGQVKESSIRKVGEIINNHPEEAVSILRNWLYQGE
jgi:flagellar M-ring protein FliF